VKMNFYAILMQAFDFVKHIHYSAVISGIRHVERNNMQVLTQCIKDDAFYSK
jgi:hypothetical protein